MSKADEMFEEIGNKINELVQAVKQLDRQLHKTEKEQVDMYGNTRNKNIKEK